MPIHDTAHLQYSIENGYIRIYGDDKREHPAYWAHPRMGRERFSAIALFHDWWGLKNVVILLANYFAGCGYYVIAPDMYDKKIATTPTEALALLEQTRATRQAAINATLTVLETHHRTNSQVAAIGMGMGGTLAYEAALTRTDLEASVAWAGFPQQYMGQFSTCQTPLMAIYGEKEPFVKPIVQEALSKELANSPIAQAYRLETIAGAGHEFFPDSPTPADREIGRQVIHLTLGFIEKYLERPAKKPII